MGFLSGGLGGVSKLVLGTDKIATAIIDAMVEASGLDDSSVGGKFDKTYVSGYEYYAGLHLGVCHGPVDEVRELTFRGKTGWSGVSSPGLDPVDGPDYVTPEPRDQEHPKDESYGATQRSDPDLIVINRAKLFGGERVEGGVLGLVEVLQGGRDQTLNSYLDSRLKSSAASDVYTPGYRGVLSLVFHSNITSVKNYIAFENLPEFAWGNSFIGTILQKNRSAKFSEPATSHTGFYWGAMTPSIKEVGVSVFRAVHGWNTPSGCWYPEKCVVVRDGEKFMNPAHIAVQSLVDLRFGMKVPVALIGQTFVAAANRFHHDDWVNEWGETVPGEAFGLGIVWTGENTIREFLADLMRYILGSIYIDPSTGLLEISVVRQIPADHVGELPLLGPSQIEDVGTYSRPTGEETVNTITVMYTQLGSEKSEGVTKSNTAMVNIYNATINDTIHLPGIKNATMAAEVCEREVMQRCSMAATYRGMRVTRLLPAEGTADQAAFTLHDGAAFRLSWPPHGVVDQVYRVTNIVEGPLEDNYIDFDAVEDSFAMTSSAYISGAPTSGWVNTNVIPDQLDLADLKLISLPYVTLVQAAGSVGVNSMPADVALWGVLASRDDGGVTNGISVYTDNSDELSEVASGQICPTSEFNGALPILDPSDPTRLATQVKVKNFIRADEYSVEGAWFIAGEEKILCTSIVRDPLDSDYLLMTLDRGVFDTVPSAHADGEKMWWFNGASAARHISTRYLSGESETLYVTAEGRIGGASLAAAPALTGTLSNDWFAPYPPANVQIDGKLWNDYPLKRFNIEWDCRDRVGQSDVPLAWDAGGVPSETGVTYTITLSTVSPETVQILMENIVVTGPIGAASLEVPSQNDWKKIKVWANREGKASTQVFTHTFTKFCGYGWSYGKRYGGATPGVFLYPGESPPVKWLTDPLPTPRPVWGGEEWIHFDASLASAGQMGPDWEAPLFVTYAGVSPAASMEVQAEAERVSGVGGTSTAVLECVRGTGAGAVYSFSEGAIGHQIVGRSDTTIASNYATQTAVSDYLPAASRVTNSITYDGAQYVFCFNYGADVYTAATDTFTNSSVRKGTVGTSNELGGLMRAGWIQKFGANYVACGADLNDSTKTIAASSTDLVSWTVQNTSVVASAADKFNWIYYPPDSKWYVFGTVGDDVTGSAYGYTTTDGFTFSPVNLGCPANAPLIGSGYAFTDSAGNWYMEVIAGAFILRKFNTAAWSALRSLRDPAQLELSRRMSWTPFTTTRPGGASSPDINSNQSLIRTGKYVYNPAKGVWNAGNQYKGALLGAITSASSGVQDYGYSLIQPSDHPYGSLIGALPDFSGAITDGGFHNTGGSVDDVYGFLSHAVGRTVSYFEVVVGKGVGELLIGVVAALGPGEATTYNTSALLQQNNRILTDVRLSCPGGLTGGAAFRTAGVPSLETTVVGVRFTQTGVSTCQCEFWVDNTAIATIPNLLYDAVWFPVFTSAGIPLSINLGQKSFQASTPASPLSWL